jgi:hypothetical protein
MAEKKVFLDNVWLYDKIKVWDKGLGGPEY